MSKKILIVEDEFVVANSLRLILEHAGYSVTGIAASTEEADEHLQKLKPDLAILDIRLSGKLSGIDFARKLRAENIAFIYLSANSSQEILEEAQKTEPYGFLVKPFREKDLLVALDIASYRHTYSLESKLRREELLQKKLASISTETIDTEQKLLKIARIIQPYIPFDLMISGSRPLDDEQFNDSGYFRTGFNEYQFIGEKELMTIAGLNRNTLSIIIEKSNIATANDVIIYNNGITNDNTKVTLLQKILFDCFKIESYLVFPIILSNGSSVNYFFYSRQRDIYTQNHVALLNCLKMSLTDVTETMLDYETPSNSVVHQPDPVDKKSGEVVNHPEFKNIIGKHPLLLAALDLTIQVAPYSTSVLILGESGTGKEKIAECIHSLSTRKDGPFVKVNCAAIPASLIESELFGHEKGAFTDAVEKRKGKFEQADGGTIFLDEIGELSLEMQVKLLRVLQEKEFDYVGGSSPIKVNTRIVAATNRNLEKEVAEGKFRLDLYYRLNVFPITLPPLRERKSDITALTLYFAEKYCKEFNKDFTGIDESMIEEMYAYNWMGNIRELENVLVRSVILNDGKSKLELKRGLIATTAESYAKENIETLEDVKNVQRKTEREYIISILKKAQGRIRGTNGAAELLNIKPTTLESKIAKLAIKREDFMNSSPNS